jgi:hypothetical protein
MPKIWIFLKKSPLQARCRLTSWGRGVKSFCWQLRWMLLTRSRNFSLNSILEVTP